MRPTTLLDLDGTIRNMVDRSILVYKEFYDPTAKITEEDIKQYDLRPTMPLIKDLGRFFIEHDDSLFNMAKLYYGARKFVNQLNEISDIQIVTSQLKGTEPATLEWILRNKIPYQSIHFASNKNSVKGDYLIDDCTDKLNSFTNGVPICIDRPWNQDYEGIRFKKYDDIINYIRGRV